MISLVLLSACTPANPHAPVANALLARADSVAFDVTVADTAGHARPFGRTFIKRSSLDDRLTLQVRGGTWGTYTMRDDLVIRKRDMAPVTETLQLPNRTFSFEYDGAKVTRTTLQPDSARGTTQQQFPLSVYAFNQMELLVQSVPLTQGYTRVVPLYSESDGKLESDTITVLERTVESSRTLWRVRFADPAIIKIITIDGASRSIVYDETTNRKSKAKFLSRPTP
jgi:hypothetical protein